MQKNNGKAEEKMRMRLRDREQDKEVKRKGMYI